MHLSFYWSCQLLCRTAVAIYSPTRKVLTHVTPYSCQHLALSGFKCLPCGWVCKMFILNACLHLLQCSKSLFICFCFAFLWFLAFEFPTKCVSCVLLISLFDASSCGSNSRAFGSDVIDLPLSLLPASHGPLKLIVSITISVAPTQPSHHSGWP